MDNAIHQHCQCGLCTRNCFLVRDLPEVLGRWQSCSTAVQFVGKPEQSHARDGTVGLDTRDIAQSQCYDYRNRRTQWNSVCDGNPLQSIVVLLFDGWLNLCRIEKCIEYGCAGGSGRNSQSDSVVGRRTPYDIGKSPRTICCVAGCGLDMDHFQQHDGHGSVDCIPKQLGRRRRHLFVQCSLSHPILERSWTFVYRRKWSLH